MFWTDITRIWQFLHSVVLHKPKVIKNKFKLENLEVMKRSPNLHNNVKICQGQPRLII